MDNAAERESFASTIYNLGVANEKREILKMLPADIKNLHDNADIHIHDLEAFYHINNCSTPDLTKYLQVKLQDCTDAQGIIYETFFQIENLITNIAKCQSGGIGFGNFDEDLSEIFRLKKVEFNDDNIHSLHIATKMFIKWVNEDRTRLCRENYYITINLGLSVNEWGREVSRAFLEKFYTSKVGYTRPNIVFKVNYEINAVNGTVNYDLFRLAMKSTAMRMIPTYLLTNSKVNSNCNPKLLNIMGCRTRVYDNVNGIVGSIGRGNIGCVSINLPRIALRTTSISMFYSELSNLIDRCIDVLMLKKDALLSNKGKFQSTIFENCVWGNISTIDEMLKEGTYSVGFIGLNETIQIMNNNVAVDRRSDDRIGYEIVSFMRRYIDRKRKEYNLNFSLLATPGEMISGRFCQMDAVLYPNSVQEKGFYTNSFHTNVDSGMGLFQKINIEGKYHCLCNGGSITYVEFESALLKNFEAIEDCINYAVKCDISYIGFNYPMDICNKCGYMGTFDRCAKCNSSDIKRIRRVSGYLEDVNYFTKGKKQEVKYRKANALQDC